MLHNPEVLILDEPTSGLDPNQIVEIRDLITTFGKEKTVLLSTHIMQEVNAMCKRVVIINKGEIVADNSIEDIKNISNTAQENIVLQTKQAIDAKDFKDLKGVLHIDTINATTLSIATENADVLKKIILKKCDELQVDFISINTQANSLEDVFRSLTK
jgi:ABC-2 type transport system ATP-binding protein